MRKNIGRTAIGIGAALAAVTGVDAATYRVRTSCARLERCHTSVQAALDAAADDRSGAWAVIDVGPGDFHEKVVLRRNRVRLIGRGAGRTRLRYDAVAERAGRYDRAGWGTAGSATLVVDADEVVIRGITIANDFDYLANDALPKGDKRRIDNSQALAVQLDVNSDRVLFDRVALVGFQDTLFTRGRRALFRNGAISGNVDFIFGSGMLLIEDSEVRTRRRAAPVPPGSFDSYVAAPSTPVSQPFGIVFHRARLTREAGVADRSVALARPWHPTTVFPDGRYADPNAVGQVAFVDCFMDAHVHPDHWTGMAGTARDGTKSRIFGPHESRFWEEGSHGPGATANGIAVSPYRFPGMARFRKALFAGWTL